jgi:hypothetical protein
MSPIWRQTIQRDLTTDNEYYGDSGSGLIVEIIAFDAYADYRRGSKTFFAPPTSGEDP